MSAAAQRQADRIAADLLAGAPVDAIAAAERHNIFRLSSIIHRLRRRGWPIDATQDNQNGLARYRLPAGWTPPPPPTPVTIKETR